MADVENQEAPAVDIQGMRSSENADKTIDPGLAGRTWSVFFRSPCPSLGRPLSASAYQLKITKHLN